MKTKRILSTILAVVIVMSTFSFGTLTTSAANNVVDVGAGGDIVAALAQLAAIDGITEGTINVTGDIDVSGKKFPAHDFVLTIKGTGSNSLKVTTNDFHFGGDTVLENINLAVSGGKCFFTNGAKITLKNATAASNSIALGASNNTVDNISITVDGGTVSSFFFGGGGSFKDAAKGVTGNAYIEVVNGGQISAFTMGPDWYKESTNATVYGDLRVKIDASSSIGNISSYKSMGSFPSYQPRTMINGYLHAVLEEGAKMPSFPEANFEHPDMIYSVTYGANGVVNNTADTGKFEIVPDSGYIAKIETPNGVLYSGGGIVSVPLGETKVSFTDAYELTDQSFDIAVTDADPVNNTWAQFAVSSDKYDISVLSVTPESDSVQYAVTYNYQLEITPKSGYRIPLDVEFTINGTALENHKIIGLSKSGDKISFRYTAEMTAKDKTRNMVSYDGGLGSSGTAPSNEFVEDETVISVKGGLFTMGGYSFAGYTTNASDKKLYAVDESVPADLIQPGIDNYTVVGDPQNNGEGDVCFYAVWKELDPCIVSFDGGASDVKGTYPETINTYIGEYIEIPENTLSKLGYRFVHWTDGVNTYNPGDMVVLTGSLTLTAVWADDSANAGNLIYVSADGSATNDGTSLATAVDSITAAYGLAQASAGNDTIVIVGTVSARGKLPAHDDNVTITGYNDNSVLNIASSIWFQGDTTVKDVQIKVAKSGTYIASNGNKVVLGPNLPKASVTGYDFDFIDGGVGTSVQTVDTTVLPGVTIGKYYIGGADLPEGAGVTGSTTINIKGAAIDTLDFSAKGTNKAKLDNLTLVVIEDGDIANLTASKSYKMGTDSAMMTIFNNGSIPEIPANLEATLREGFQSFYLVDSGVGGTVEPLSRTDLSAIATGKVSIVADDPALPVYRATTGTYYLVSSTSTKLDSTGVTKIRFGMPYAGTDTFVVSVSQPSGGASVFALNPDVTSGPACVVTIDSWTPSIPSNTGKFEYNTHYTANLLFTPASGSFFDVNNLPLISVNNELVSATLNSDGTLSVSYSFAEMTGDTRDVYATFTVESDVTGTFDAPTSAWKHLGTYQLPSAMNLKRLGFAFKGWRCNADGKLYNSGGSYTVNTDAETVEFVAEWRQLGSWNLPTVLLLYDLTKLASETGRNPRFAEDADPIYIDKAFAALEHTINGTKNTKTVKEFDYEKDVTIVTSDGGSNPMKINNWSLNKAKAKLSEYRYVTVVYYYETTAAAAAGQNGICRAINAELPDGSTKSIGKYAKSIQTVVANKWAYVTFDMTEAYESSGIDGESFIRQLQISPIGDKACAELVGDNLYLKSLILSKSAPVEE